ncbi:MAG: DUF4097 family beta strand repeat-containing protein [Bryobacteraceae bacterium]
MRTAGLVCMAGLAAVSAFAAEGMFERKLSVKGLVDLDVVSDSGRIAIRTGPAGTVRVVGHIKSGLGSWLGGSLSAEEKVKRLEAQPPVEQTGSMVRIGHIRDRELERNVSISYEIEVPADCRVKSHSDSGSQSIEGVKGPVEAEADSGSIQLRSINGSVNAKADSGSITGTAIAGGIDASTDSGRIEMEQTVAGPIRISSDSGSVSLRLPSNGGYDVNASSDSGHVTSDVALTARGTISHNRMQGQLRGGGNTLRVSTDSGSIRLQ